MIANAGVSVFEPYLERPELSIDLVMDVNLKGTLFCIQKFIKHRKKVGGRGAIVNIGSHYGVVSPDPRIYTDCDRKNSEIYGATKAAIIQMTRYFAVHAAEYNIRTNVISPVSHNTRERRLRFSKLDVVRQAFWLGFQKFGCRSLWY